ncbi:hypothetical protein ACFQMA_09250 [Halosimplex aquaticum]|uniref:Uncharacterized protein n=1 Tax=Halosimplex aquaticum TaxID=3026162 RepID=A0ABD5XY12_9EURY|nr:hypothetical protein [Halosimplex aquaticum]
MRRQFPAEALPDGNLAVPHHYYLGAIILLIAVMVVWDNYPEREPVWAGAAVLFGLYGFLSAWPRYPPLGAGIVLASTAVAVTAPFRPAWWRRYPYRWQLVAVLGALIMLDDAVSHSLGVWTPLDAVWKSDIRPALGLG